MRLVRSALLSVTLLGASLGAVACGGTVEQPPQTTASALTKAPVGASTHGAIKVVGDALGDVGLRPEQRTEIEKLALDAEVRHQPMLERRKELMLAFADQVEKGSIDHAALQPRLDNISAEMDRIGAEDRSALVKLHDLLDSDQRNAFVDALQKQMKAKHGGPGPKGFAKMKQLADDLKLTDEQRNQIREIMRDGFKDAMQHRGESVAAAEGATAHRPPAFAFGHPGKKALEAFREDKLDATKLGPPPEVKAMFAGGAAHMMTVAEKIVPILTPEQRKAAADKLRTSAASHDLPMFEH